MHGKRSLIFLSLFVASGVTCNRGVKNMGVAVKELSSEDRAALKRFVDDMGSYAAASREIGINPSLLGRYVRGETKYMTHTNEQKLLPYLAKYFAVLPPPRKRTNIQVRELAVFGTGNAADYSTGYVMGDVVPDNDHVLDRIVTTQTNAVASFRVEGDSMSGSDIADGDYVVCGPPPANIHDLPQNSLVCAKYDDVILVKLWSLDTSGGAHLLSTGRGQHYHVQVSELEWVLPVLSIVRMNPNP
jgi:hypothetical protein